MGATKMATLGVGVVGLAIALSLAAFASPSRTAAEARVYTPESTSVVVAHTPPSDPEELAMRRALATRPDQLDLALELARNEIRRYRSESDPRYLGHAQALLARWWKTPVAEATPELLLVRATIRQAIHEFPPARADLDRLVALAPLDAQAQLTRAVVATVTGDYAAARESCGAVRVRIARATCTASLDGLAGRADAAYGELAAAIASEGRIDPAVRGWAVTALAELAIQKGDRGVAEKHLREAIAIDPDDHYARAALADILLDGRTSEVPALLAGREQIDALLLRRAIAEHQLHEGTEYADRVRARFAAAAERGDRVHLREEARFVLEVEGNATRALELAKADWNVQKELADARILAAAALAAGDEQAIAPLRDLHDAQLEALLGRFQ